MKTERTTFGNIFYMLDDDGKIIGIKINPGRFERKYCVGDAVKVTGDIYGYICPGITSPGTGKIIEVHRDSTDGFFTVEMENGDIGYSVKADRLEIIK